MIKIHFGQKLLIILMVSFCSCNQPQKNNTIVKNNKKDSIRFPDTVIKSGFLKLVDKKDKLIFLINLVLTHIIVTKKFYYVQA